jgi:predicted nucleotide-binding protein (sugar kinase/HSP70/actin superfamily)
VADLLVEIEEVLRVVGAPGSVGRLRDEWERFAAGTSSLQDFDAGLPAFIDRLASFPRTRDPRACPRVVVTGEFFTRFSDFFMEGVHELYASRGIILKPVDLDEMLLYMAYQPMAGTALDWNMKPGGLALAKACTRVFQPDGKQYLRQWATYHAEQRSEIRYRRLFQKSGLLVAGANDVVALFEKATPHVSLRIYGEALPMVGKGLSADGEGYDGVILIGPFNCLPFRISEAILKPLSIRDAMPLLAYESDGYSVAPSFVRQVDVHIQQVLERFARRRVARPSPSAPSVQT